MATQLQTRKPSDFELELAAYEPQIAAALPSNIKPAMFRRVIITAVNQKPELLNADRRSFFVSCVKCAQDGLLPDGREAALVVYNTKDQDSGQWVPVVQYQPMYQGIAKRARNTGLVANIGAHLVYSLDSFSYTLGDDERIEHRPAIGNRGAVLGAYSVITLTDGGKVRDFMSTAEINAVRARSKAKDKGPWVTDWGEMARKTVFRRCAKWAPMSADISDLLHRDDDQYEPEAPAVNPQPQPKRLSKLERFEQDTRADGPAPEGNSGAPQQEPAGAEQAPPEAAPVPVIDVPGDDAGLKAWQEYREALIAAIRTAPSRTWLSAFEEANHDGMAKLAADFPQNRKVAEALAGRAAELGA